MLYARTKLLLARVPVAYMLAHRLLTGIRFLVAGGDPDFGGFRHFRDRPGLFLDVGANVGQSALSFRRVNRTAPILSIEANAELERDLRLVRRVLRGFDYRICGASDTSGELTLYMPVYRSLVLSGEASVDRVGAREPFWAEGVNADPTRFSIKELTVQTMRLDDLGLAPAIIKIDVEGHEAAVLRGLETTITGHRPVILLEGPDDEITQLLGELDYRPFVYDSRTDRFEPGAGSESTRNVFFLPEELAAVTHTREHGSVR